jgi:HK97 gp10 family phage protein
MSLSSRLFAAKIDVMTRAMSAYVDLAIKEAADIIVSDMNRRVPVDTGTLASTISVERLGPMKYRIKAGGLKTTKGRYDYATGVEFGNHHAPAQPFFYSAYRANKRQAKDGIRKAVKQAVRSAIR